MQKEELNRYRTANIMSCEPATLVDLRDIRIDTQRSVHERINSFMHQVRNPYLFKVDDVIMKVNFGNDRSVTDAFASVFLEE